VGLAIDPPVTAGQKPASWDAIAALGAGAFALITAEFLPVGLLPQIAGDLAISDGQAGLMVTMPGIAAACSAILTISVAKAVDRRYVLWFFLALMVVSNLVVACAGGLLTLLAGRLFLGVAVGGFWTIGVSLGARLRPDNAGRATSIIFSGVTLGTVAGVPAGTLLGGLLGWRVAFAVSAALALLIALALVRVLPVIRPERSSGISQVPAVLRLRKVQVGLVAVVFIFVAQFTAYTYVSPFLAQVSGIGPTLLSGVLLSYGVSGIFGNLFCGWLVGRDVRRAVLGTAMLMGGSLLLLLLTRESRTATVASVVAWGFAFGMLPIAIQSWIFSAAPDHMESVAALFVAITQLAIGAGALLGGLVVDHHGVVGALALGATGALVAAIWIFTTFPGSLPLEVAASAAMSPSDGA
jgi:predicted MFS family arabinose efflux permease